MINNLDLDKIYVTPEIPKKLNKEQQVKRCEVHNRTSFPLLLLQ